MDHVLFSPTGNCCAAKISCHVLVIVTNFLFLVPGYCRPLHPDDQLISPALLHVVASNLAALPPRLADLPDAREKSMRISIEVNTQEPCHTRPEPQS